MEQQSDVVAKQIRGNDPRPRSSRFVPVGQIGMLEMNRVVSAMT